MQPPPETEVDNGEDVYTSLRGQKNRGKRMHLPSKPRGGMDRQTVVETSFRGRFDGDTMKKKRKKKNNNNNNDGGERE